MSNPMMYIKKLEAAGFERAQAEAQVQMVLDALEGDLATKADIQILESNLNSKTLNLKSDLKSEFRNDIGLLKTELAEFKNQVEQRFLKIEGQIRETELRLITRMGFMMATITSIAVAFLAWLIRV